MDTARPEPVRRQAQCPYTLPPLKRGWLYYHLGYTLQAMQEDVVTRLERLGSYEALDRELEAEYEKVLLSQQH